MMKHKYFGFTLIEVSLFLAVTGALFVAIIAGTQNAIWQQKYNDSVQNYANFLRSVYAQVSNPQSIGDGRTDKAIYGKLITFGQTYNLDGGLVANDNKEQEIFVYDVIGNADIEGTGSITTLFGDEDNEISLVRVEGDRVDFAGFYESYTPTWGAVIETANACSGAECLYKGSILVVRHPRSGAVNTLVSGNKENQTTHQDVLQVNEAMKNARAGAGSEAIEAMLRTAIKNGYFETKQVDFCLNPYGAGVQSGLRRDIRLISSARNASGVEVIDLVNDKNVNLCAR